MPACYAARGGSVEAVFGEELIRRRSRNDLAAEKHSASVGAFRRKFNVVSDRYYGHPAFRQLSQQRHDPLLGSCVKSLCRLVEQQQFRSQRQNFRERDKLFFAAGQVIRVLVEVRRKIERQRPRIRTGIFQFFTDCISQENSAYILRQKRETFIVKRLVFVVLYFFAENLYVSGVRAENT